MINAGDTVTLCIGGRVFVTRRATLYRLPDSRLFMIANKTTDPDTTSSIKEKSGPKKDPPVYFFDRDPEIFRFVLDYYRTGELHLPSSICGPFVRKELIFWGIDESLIGACCMPAYMRYDEEKRTKKTLFRDFFEDIDSMKNLVKYCRGFKRWRYQMWLFLDHPSSSMASKAWASILLGLMIISFMCFCLSTHEAFRRKAKRTINYNTSSICTQSNILSNRKINKDCTTETHNALLQLDVILNIIFTLEFVCKLCLAPYKLKFLKSSICILDICILSAYWLYMSSFYFYYYYKVDTIKNATTLWALNVLSMTQCLRILRIFKISKISRGLRVLMLTIKKSIPELVLLAFLLMNGMFLFSSLIYMAEYKEPRTFPDIPKAFWWSIVTLTTVGYGDSYPKGGPGYLVGSMTAICGCILTGLAIPIIGNNFNTYYMYMKNQLKEDKYLRELRKDMNHVGANVTKGNAHKAKYTKFGGKPKSCGTTNGGNGTATSNSLNNSGSVNGNNISSTNAMYRRKFTTVECPNFNTGLPGINLNCSPQPLLGGNNNPTTTTTSSNSTQINDHESEPPSPSNTCYTTANTNPEPPNLGSQDVMATTTITNNNSSTTIFDCVGGAAVNQAFEVVPPSSIAGNINPNSHHRHHHHQILIMSSSSSAGSSRSTSPLQLPEINNNNSNINYKSNHRREDYV